MGVTLESVHIKDFKHIKEFDFKAGQVTVIYGRNGTGKSSLLDAIKTIFHGGHDPDMIRTGAKRAVIGMTVMDDGQRITATKIIRPSGIDLEIKRENGGIIKPPKAWVAALASGFAFDPIAFVTATKAKRVEFLLEALPLEFSPDELSDILEPKNLPVQPINLKALSEFRTGIEDTRREQNKELNTILTNVETLEGGLDKSEDADTDWAAKAVELQESLIEQRSALATDKFEFEAQRDRLVSEVETEASREIDQLERECGEKVKAVAARRDASRQKIVSEAARVYEEGSAEAQTKINDLSTEHGIAAQRARETERTKGIKASIEKLKTTAKGYRPSLLTAKLKKIDALKATKLKEINMEGIDFQDGDILVANNPWKHVNKSEKYVVAIQFAALHTGRLGLIICDDAEQLDPGRFIEFRDALIGSGLQVITARAEGGDLRVETYPPEPTP